jgi:hypothetical protein
LGHPGAEPIARTPVPTTERENERPDGRGDRSIRQIVQETGQRSLDLE